MSNPLTPERLAEIRAHHECGLRRPRSTHVHELLAEVDRLQTENQRLAKELRAAMPDLIGEP